MMPDREKVIKWFEYDYLPRIGAYRKDCKQGCDACMPMHDGDDYCDIDMLCKILALLKEQETVIHCIDCCYYHKPEYGFTFGDCTRRSAWYQVNEKDYCSLAKRKEGR